jgi:hypothetical protein
MHVHILLQKYYDVQGLFIHVLHHLTPKIP